MFICHQQEQDAARSHGRGLSRGFNPSLRPFYQLWAPGARQRSAAKLARFKVTLVDQVVDLSFAYARDPLGFSDSVGQDFGVERAGHVDLGIEPISS